MKHLRSTALLVISVAFATACNKKAPTAPNYKGAIDAFYQTHPVCLWPEEKKFPVQAASSDDAKTQGYDALVDQGLLTRTTSEKKIIIISKRENNYDLSAAGRSAWTADPSQPGYGNFCYGHREVSSIDGNSPITGDPSQPGATTTVSYHTILNNVADWAKAPETQTAFPSVQAALAGPESGSSVLTNTAQGWQVTSTRGSANDSNNSATPADSHIVR